MKVSHIEQLVNLWISEGKLPGERILVSQTKHLQHGENEVATLLRRTTAAATAEVTANIDFKFLASIVFEHKFGGAGLRDQEKSKSLGLLFLK